MNHVAQLSDPQWLVFEKSDKATDFVIVIVARQFNDNKLGTIKTCLNLNRVSIQSFRHEAINNLLHIAVSAASQQAVALFDQLLQLGSNTGFDVAMRPADSKPIKLLLCDMDSTIVQTETLDELASHAGAGEQVKAITAKAMLGEIEFMHALDERVGLLGGLSADLLDDVARAAPLTAGTEKLIAITKAQGIRTVLVTSGFDPIAKVIANKVGFDRYVANELLVEANTLTGKTSKPVVDSAAKLAVMLEECDALNIGADQVCAIGDGANDLDMIQTAGIGISYYGKPLLRAATPYQINNTDISTAIHYMGLPA